MKKAVAAAAAGEHDLNLLGVIFVRLKIASMRLLATGYSPGANLSLSFFCSLVDLQEYIMWFDKKKKNSNNTYCTVNNCFRVFVLLQLFFYLDVFIIGQREREQ